MNPPKNELGSHQEDLQKVIAGYGEAAPSEVWEALEAVKPFLNQSQLPPYSISMTGTGSVFQR